MTGQEVQVPVPAPPPASPVPPVTDLASLQTQVADLQVQLSGLQAQWTSLQSQLNAMLKNNPARPGVQQQWADVGVQRARVEGDIARLEARIAQIRGVATTTTAPGGFGRRGFDSNRVIPLMTVVMLVLALPVSLAWARRLRRGAPRPSQATRDLTMRLDRMEHAVDAIAIEVERVSEGQRFVTKLVAGQPAKTPAQDDASARASNDLASAAQQKQPLALGAGAIEPIVIQDRDRVRERVITPH